MRSPCVVLDTVHVVKTGPDGPLSWKLYTSLVLDVNDTWAPLPGGKSGSLKDSKLIAPCSVTEKVWPP